MKRMTYLCRIGRTSLGLPRQAKADMSIKTAQLPALCLLNQYGIKKLSTVSDNKSKKCLVKSGKDISFSLKVFASSLRVFIISKIIFPFSLIFFPVCAESFCYKVCNGHYKVSNMCYKLCNKNFLIGQEKLSC